MTRRFRFFLFLVSAMCVVSAGAQFWLTPRSLTNSSWVSQFSVILGISLILSLLLLLYGSTPRTVAVFLLLRFVTLAIIGIPEGARIGLVGSLASAFTLEIIYYMTVPLNKILSAAFLLAVFCLRLPVYAWHSQVPRPAIIEILPIELFLALLAIAADLHRHWAEMSNSQGEQISHLEDVTVQLTSANLGFQQYADTIQEKSAIEERDRITREIHDTVGYALINILMLMEEALLLAKDHHSLKLLLDQARKQSQTGLDETRRALRLLRAADRPLVRTIDGIRRLASAFQSATGVKVSVEYGNIPFTLSDGVSETVFSMLQEGMANALRHGKATAIHVMFWQSDSELIVNLSDNGTGSDIIKEGIGHSGMRERIARLGGQFIADNIPNGFQITARIPHSPKGRAW